MKARMWIVVFFAAALLSGSPAGAQYLFLDSNGDGIPTGGDAMNANGLPTLVDVYLITDRNRDGSAAACNVETQPLSINSYVLNLRAVNGTVTYGGFVNRQPVMFFNFGELNPGNGGYKNGFGGPNALNPGRYLLCTLTITGGSGTPAIQVVDRIPGASDITSFGSRCSGLSFDNTYKLDGPNTQAWQGSGDWFDADGLAAGTGTPTNDPPTLAAPADMTVSPGDVGVQTATASDPDAQFLSLDLVSPPGFVDLEVVELLHGSVSAKLFAAPRVQDLGSTQVTLRVSDGQASDQKTFTVTVPEGSNHAPWLTAVRDVSVPPGGVKRIPLHAGDVDGSPLTLERTSGPDYSSLHMLRSRSGAAVGYLEIAPGSCDGGAGADVRILCSDGIDSHARTFHVNVPFGATTERPDSLYSGGPVSSVATGDLDRDGTNDVVVGHRSFGISVVLNREGEFTPPVRYPFDGEILDMEIADLNGDGYPDVAAANFNEAAAPIWFNQGNGILQGPVFLPLAGRFSQNVAADDLNADDLADLTVSSGGYVSVFKGSAGPLRREDWYAAVESYGLTLGDFNLDGLVDVFTSNHEPDSIATLLAREPGGFKAVKMIGPGVRAFRIGSSDFDWDGWLDLVILAWSGPTARIVIQRGDGTSFTTVQVIDAAQLPLVNPDRVVCEDMDLDGVIDLVVSDYGTGRVTILKGRGDATFGEPRSTFTGATGLAVGDLDGNGWPDVATGSNSSVLVWWNPGQDQASMAQARAFVPGSRAIPVGGPTLCLRFEPVSESYGNTDVDLSSLTLASSGTGSVTSIGCIPPKSAVQADQDGNGIAELAACFAPADVARLFDQLTGRATVTATLAGNLHDGAAFCTPVALTLVRTGQPPGTAFVWPNPLNPRGVLRVSTSGAGMLRVKVYDVQGRLVRTLAERTAEPGDHDIEVDGMDDEGRPLGSGMFFYIAETTDGKVGGRFAVLK